MIPVLHGHQCSPQVCVMQSRSLWHWCLCIPFIPCSLCLPCFHIPLRLPQSKTFIWPFFCLFFISRQEVISAKLTIDPVENSTIMTLTVTVKSYVAKCLVVSEDLWVMVSGEREEKYPHKWFQSELLIWSEISSHKVTYKCFCMH